MTPTEVNALVNNYKDALRLLQATEKGMTLNQLVFKKYIEVENASLVAKYVRDKNMKAPNGNSIQQTHIKDILESTPDDVSRGAVNIAQSIFSKNQKLAARIWG